MRPAHAGHGPAHNTLTDFRNAHGGETIVVCGCGESLTRLEHPERLITIGVNDVGRRFDPTYLVVLNPRSQFAADRFAYVERSRAKYLFTQLDLGVSHPAIVKFRLGQYGGTTFNDPGILHYTRNSPYVALCLAVHMGARRIGLIGVDFTDHHFFGPTGVHPLSRRLSAIDAEYRRLRTALDAMGIQVINLSPQSRLTAFDKGTLDDPPPAKRPQSERALHIVSYATTPVAGVPAILARCVDARTPHRSRCVWARRSYGDGFTFDGDVEWTTRPDEADGILHGADLVIAHNGKVDPRHARLVEGKPVVTLAHNYMWNVDRQFEQRGMPALVVGQYQATLPEFAGWTVVPNPIPIWESSHMPEPKPDVVTICYTPSGRYDRYPPGHRLYWHGKGYHATIGVLERLAASMPIRLEVVTDRQVSHAHALAMKRRAHIVIDECVTGSYHRNSLEGLAAACVVINAVGLLPGVKEALFRCAPGADTVPFVFSTLDTLETVLRGLIERGTAWLADEGRANRTWMERHWDFSEQWTRSWAPAVDAAIAAPGQRTPAIVSRHREPDTREHQQEDVVQRPGSNTVSVVVPHGGSERLPHLIATLTTLRQRPGVGEVIVVEMGTTPVAQEVASRWADKHLFIEHGGPFERASALNAGGAVAEYDFVLWHDNDLLTPPAFVAACAKEIAERRLDFLIPYTSVRYLSESDSQAVMQGVRSPDDCQPLHVLHSAKVSFGAMGLVRREFLARHGGHIEGFRGWGGEDNAWNRKVALLGRSARTTRADQHVHHLYHRCSGGYVFADASASNPQYAENVALMEKVCSIRRPMEFIRHFPPAPPAAGVLTRSNGHAGRSASQSFPIWVYWEGPCPRWIRACRRTILAHAPSVRLLTPASFSRMRDRDRDIDLSRLDVVHRADFIRAYLLRHFGGLWIDADCLVMQPLEPLLAELERVDFIGSRERVGLVSNAFIAARPGSRIAEAYYNKVCAILRARRPIQWNGIGADVLTEVVSADSTGWHELPCERIQPVCWSRPQDFFVHRDPAGHEAVFDARALCYMLSNVTLKNWLAKNGDQDLMHERTFFSYLLQRTLGVNDAAVFHVYEELFAGLSEAYRAQGCESASGPGSSLAQTSELRDRLPLVLQDLGIRTLLDAPCGDFHWMQHVQSGVERYIGVDIQDQMIADNQYRYAAPSRRFIHADLVTAALPRADAVLCRDVLGHLSFAEITKALENFKRSGARYLMATTFTGERPNVDIAVGGWRTLNLTRAPFNFPEPFRQINEKCTEVNGTFSDKCLGVWKFEDLP